MPLRTWSAWVVSLAVAAALATSTFAFLERDRLREARRDERVATSRFLALAATQHATSDPELAMLLALEAFRHVEDQPADVAGDARRALLRTARASASLRVVLRGHRRPVTDVVVSPDGRTIASADSSGSIRLWSAARRTQTAALEGPRGDTNLVFDPRGRWLASFTTGGSVALWQAPWSGVPRRWRVPSPLWSLAFSPDGRTVATGGGDGARLWRAPSGTQIGSRLGRQQTVHVGFSSRERLVTVGTGLGVEVFDLEHAQRVRSGFPSFCADRRCSREFTDDVAGGMLSPDGRTVGVVGVHGVVGLQTPGGPARRLPSIVGDEIGLLAFSPDSRTIATADQPYDTIRLFDVATLRPTGPPVTPHDRRVTAVAFFPDSSTMAVGGEDGTVRILRKPRREPAEVDPLWRRTDSTPIEPIVSASGRVVVTATPAGVVRVADPRRPRSSITLPVRADFVELSPDGSVLVTADRSSDVVTVWDPERGVQAGASLSGELYPIGFDAEGRRVLFTDCCAFRVGLVLWRRDAPPLMAPGVLPPGEDAWGGAVFSAAGRAVAVTTYEDRSTGDLVERIRLFDLERLAPLGPPLPGGAAGFDVAFAPDGATLAYLDDAGLARVWDVREARPLSEPLGTGDGPLAFSPDGTILGTAVTDPFETRLRGGARLVTGTRVNGDWLPWELDAWQARTCDVVRRSLGRAEWERFLPAEPYRRTCP